MKLLILLFNWVSLFTEPPRCASSGIFPLSQSRTLGKDQVIIMEFFWQSQSLVKDLNKKYPVYLINEQTKIPLDVIQVLTGDFRLTEVVFKPSSELTVGLKYEFFIEGLSGPWSNPYVYNNITGKRELVSYTIVSSQSKKTGNRFVTLPVEKEKSIVQFGCGPAKSVVYNIGKEEQAGYYVKTYLKDIGAGTETVYIVPVDKGTITIGHGMCSGGFVFKGCNPYHISFSLVDLRGNEGPKTEPVLLIPPEENRPQRVTVQQ